ncbi:MAG: tol-pal system-associated acyl-CoA thioesterase [Nevskiales bacterium]|nr:tol-pal system-associated acyl-CoA thioesterase [Nevskiales bacterium]
MLLPEFIWPERVYYEDTDTSGVVYHAAYLRFLERARTEWLRMLGHSQEDLRSKLHMAFVVARMEIDFLHSARLDDELLVSIFVEQHRRASLMIVQTVRRADNPGVKLVHARVRIGCVNLKTSRPRPFPDKFFSGVA